MIDNADSDNTPHRVSRRQFLHRSALASALATGAGALSPKTGGASETSPAKPQADAASSRSLAPKMLLDGRASLSRPSLGPSQLSFRLGLARTRTASSLERQRAGNGCGFLLILPHQQETPEA